MDADKIRAEADRHFFLVVGRRSDLMLITLIPDAENVLVIDGICSICQEPGSFESADGRSVLCRGCRILERERIAVMDARIQNFAERFGKDNKIL